MNDWLRRSGNPSAQGARRKDMPGIFDDERRRTGGFQRGLFEVGTKSFPNASKMLDGGRHRPALFSCSATISDTDAANR
jgi:hypothetical protein